uniref:Uncharacterized protein n=1 Tax=Rhizophora mucronata TaxID=61149 RepID=A0A2P2NZ48_RHIMU
MPFTLEPLGVQRIPGQLQGFELCRLH